MVTNCTVLQAVLGEWVELEDGRSGIVGEQGFGVPLTIKLTGVFMQETTEKNGATLNGCPYIALLPETPPLLFTTQSSQSHGVQFGGSPPVFSHNGMPRATDVFHVRTLAGKALVHTC